MTGPICGQDDDSLLSNHLVDISYSIYIYVCTRWPYPNELRPAAKKGCLPVRLYRMEEESLRLTTILEIDCRMDHVDLLCQSRESCNTVTWSSLEMYIVPPALVGAVAGRAISSLVCQLRGGDRIMCCVCPSGPERLIRIMSGSIGHLLRNGWTLVVRLQTADGEDLHLPACVGQNGIDAMILKTSLEG
jgi:hypothetical protein